MDIDFLSSNKEVVHITLLEGEEIIVNDPSRIIAFNGDEKNRKDYIDTDIKKIIGSGFDIFKSILSGKCNFYINSINNSQIRVFDNINGDDLFIENVLFYSKEIESAHELEGLLQGKKINKFIKTKYIGEGKIGFYAQGEVVEITINEGDKLFVSFRNVIGFTSKLKYEFRVYGNQYSRQTMDYNYMFSGVGRVLIQTQSIQADIFKVLEGNDGIFKRTLREIVPFGGIIFK